MNSPLVSVDWLNKHLDHEELVLLDASMRQVVGQEPIVYEQFSCIPGALKCDLENVFVDLDSTELHAMPSPAQFNRAAAALGIHKDSHIIVYDDQGIYSSPRAWWMLRSMGLENVQVLDGGLPAWLAHGLETGDEYGSPGDSSLQAVFRAENVCGTDQVLQAKDSQQCQLLDARSVARFKAQVPEPRPGVRGGHIPGSINVPFPEVLEGHFLKTPEQLRSLFRDKGVVAGSRIICSCGSGITACILLLALEVAGYADKTLYDGSWAEWGANEALPIEVG